MTRTGPICECSPADHEAATGTPGARCMNEAWDHGAGVVTDPPLCLPCLYGCSP